MSKFRIWVALFVVAATPLASWAQREKLPPDDLDYVEKKWPDAKKSNTGMRYVIEKAGTGPLLKPGDIVMVNYIGMLLSGKVFDKNLSATKPFTFRVDRSEVIQGWDQIFQLMRPGDHWLVIIPPELAYGRRGYAPVIPSDATLLFDITVLGVKKET